MKYKQVSKNLYRGQRPESFQRLKDIGIDVVVDLQSGIYESVHEDVYEYEKKHVDLERIFGIRYADYDLSDITVVKQYQLTSIVKDIRLYLRSGKCIYVHCLHGKDRTGCVIFAHRVINEDWKVWKALVEMFREGFHWMPYIVWVPRLVWMVLKIKKMMDKIKKNM